MAGQRGRDIVVKVGDGGEPETFAVVAGIRARSIVLGAGLVEATTAESPGGWRELIAGAGTKRIEVAGSGAFRNAASDALLRAAFFAGDAPRMRLEVAAFGVIEGPFAIAELAYSGLHADEALFSIWLVSAGAVSFEA
jgi:TP901-1 family phage major tail protein